MNLARFRVKLGISILIAITLLSNVSTSLKMFGTFPDFLAVDNVTVNESRFIGLKKYLDEHKDIKEVGYINELKDSHKIFSLKTISSDEEKNNKGIDIIAQLILVQYTLSPVFVYNQTDLEYVVGNFPKGLPEKSFFMKKHLIPVKVFPNGVILLRNGDSK